MNLPNRITIFRLFLAFTILVLLVFPWYQVGIEWKSFLVFDKITVNLVYIIAGILFLIASITDFLDGYIARSRNMVTDFGKVMDAIADKVLVNGLLIILAYHGFISLIIPVVIISRDIIVDSIKMAAGNTGKVIGASKIAKIKTICVLSGITLLLFYNLPFELVGINVADILIIIGTILSIISGCQYYLVNKEAFASQK